MQRKVYVYRDCPEDVGSVLIRNIGNQKTKYHNTEDNFQSSKNLKFQVKNL
jgi:hypothetical protein